MIKFNKSDKLSLKKTMSKKSWVKYCMKNRRPDMGRPVMFKDKRYSEKYKYHYVI